MPQWRKNSVKLTIRLLPEDIARLDELSLPDEPRSTAAARLLQRVLRQPEPIDAILDALRRIEQRLSALGDAPAMSEPPEPTPPEPTPSPDAEPGGPSPKPNGAPRPKQDLGLAGILEGFDLP